MPAHPRAGMVDVVAQAEPFEARGSHVRPWPEKANRSHQEVEVHVKDRPLQVAVAFGDGIGRTEPAVDVRSIRSDVFLVSRQEEDD